MGRDSDFRGVWERRADETDLQFDRFVMYLNMAERNISELARDLGVAPTFLRSVAASKNWTSRAAAFDRYMRAEIEQKAQDKAAISIVKDTKGTTAAFLDRYEELQRETLEMREELLSKVRAMLKFEVGNASKTARKVFRSRENGANADTLNIVSTTVVDPRWSWGDMARMMELADEMGRQALNVPPDVMRKLPDFVFELNKHGHDPADFMQRTIDALRAS